MNGYSSHTLKLVNKHGQASYVKWHFKTDQEIKNLDAKQARDLAASDPDYATRDLFEAIAKGQFPTWSVYIQRMTEDQVHKYRFNPWDVTKVWPHGDYPLIPVGKLTLNRNPENYFAEVEQAAFSPSHMVPGIEPTVDKMLQGRLFSYPDTHRHRLGTNYLQIPVNAPLMSIKNYMRDGFMAVNGNGGSGPNYEPNSHDDAPKPLPNGTIFTPFAVEGKADRYHPNGGHASTTERVSDIDFVQAGALYRLQSPEAKIRLVENIAGHLCNAKPAIQKLQLTHFKRADPEYGARVQEALVKHARSRL